ncbi:MAG: tetratricopeptide repeat protein [Halopseudomonas sp.]
MKGGPGMKWLVGAGCVLLVGCAGQPSSSIPVEERGYDAPPVSSAQAGAAASPSVSATTPSTDSSTLQRVEPSTSVTDSSAEPTASPSSYSSAPAVSSYAGPSPALLALMEQADGLESKGDQQGALAQLERAQRIAPRDPLVYLQLARLRLHMNDRARAEQLARRGLSLSGGDADLDAAFKALLAELDR